MNDKLTFMENGRERRAARYICQHCGSEFLNRIKLKKGRGKYCSRECAYAAKRAANINLACALCGDEFTRVPSKMRSKSGFYFCSRACKDQAQAVGGGFDEMLPPHYGIANGKYQYRETAFKAYPHRCADCGYNVKKVLVVHHIDGNRDNASVDNLVILCRNCHYLKHNMGE